jgi:hypothetical protein
VDDNLILKHYVGKQVELASMAAPQTFDSNCRMMGPIQGWDNVTMACNQTAQALGPAVQDLIKKAVSDPAFQKLL